MTDKLYEETWNKIVKGIKDYCDTYGFTGVTFGLSGGMDSAFVAAAAADALGAKNVHCYMMSTQNTTKLSKDLAKEMANLIGLDYQEIDITNIFETFKKTYNQTPKVKTTYENMQARIRGTIVMTFANDNPWLALCCGNKSEGAMGYCTLYGDTCGGLAPIGDLYKTEIYAIANWRNKQNRVIPEGIISRAPSAELSPDQKDEDSLPKYALLDPILIAYLEEGKEKEEIISQGFDEKTVEWIINQYQKTAFKREQSAPAIKIR